MTKIRHLTRYINTLEEFLESKMRSLDEVRESYLRKQGYSETEIADRTNPETNLEMLVLNIGDEAGFDYFFDAPYFEQVFPNLLRKSFFVASYSNLENALVAQCNFMSEHYHLEPMPKKSKGAIIEQAADYLEQTVKVRFPKTREWVEINGFYRKVRNCIVHSEGRLEDNTPKDLIEGIKRHPCMKLAYDEIVLLKGFCEQALNDFGTFEQQLDEQVRYPNWHPPQI